MKTLTNDLINNSENIVKLKIKLVWNKKGQWIVKEKIEEIKLWILEKIFTIFIKTNKSKKKKKLENANLIYDKKIEEIVEKIHNLQDDSFQQIKNSLIDSDSEFTNLIEKEEILINFKNTTENLLDFIKKIIYQINENLEYEYIDLISSNSILSTLSYLETEKTKKYIGYLNEELKIYQEDIKNLKINFNQIEFKQIETLKDNLTDTISDLFWWIDIFSYLLISQLDKIKENIKIIEEDINKILKHINKNLNSTQDKINITLEYEKEKKLLSFYLNKYIEISWENIEEITNVISIKWWKAWKLKIWWKYYPFMSIWEEIEIIKYDNEWNQINWYNPSSNSAENFHLITWWIAWELKIWNNNDELKNETYAFKWIKWKEIEILKNDQNWDKINLSTSSIDSYPWWLKLCISKKYYWDNNEYKWTKYYDAIWENWKKINVCYKDTQWNPVEKIINCEKVKWWTMWLCQSFWSDYLYSLSWEQIKIEKKDKEWNPIEEIKEMKHINNWITWILQIKWKKYLFKWIMWEEIQIWKKITYPWSTKIA